MHSKVSAVTRALMMLVLPSAVLAVPIQWRIEDGGNGHWYELVGNYLDHSQRWNWQTYKAMAENRSHLGAQGHLVTVTSAEKPSS